MPVLFSYLLKLSISLSLVYLFYRFVLRRLTFYNWNRFYLVIYTLLSFFVPFINITPVLEKSEIKESDIIRFVPSFETLNIIAPNSSLHNEARVLNSWSIWDWSLLVLLIGVSVFLVRLIIQLLSFRKIITNSKLISDEEIKLYQVDQPIIPFSFGQSIFINRDLHSEEELKDIIRHEIIHVRQKHTADIIWSEMLCIVNWYNPFAWFIRKAVRQNLEFIADNKVLQTGIDRKQYQYLLLKVIGNNHFSIAPNFNFSSLKKRIAMMNKMKSAKLHLVKFLFVLPLMIVLLLSFRHKQKVPPVTQKYFHLSGIVYDNNNDLPLPDVTLTESTNGFKTATDAKGFYRVDIPIKSIKTQGVKIDFFRKGYMANTRRFEIELNGDKDRSSIGFFSLMPENSLEKKTKPAIFLSVEQEHGTDKVKLSYDFVKQNFENYLNQKISDSLVYEKGIFSIEEVNIDKVTIDTTPEKISLNNKGYNIDIKNEDGKDIVVVKNRYKRIVKEIFLLDWNKDKEYFENKYGKGVDEVIEHAVKQSMGLEKRNDQQYFHSDSIFMRSESFERNDVAAIDTATIISDTVIWSALTKQLFFKGQVTLKDERTGIETVLNANLIGMNTGNFYVVVDGKELTLKDDYKNYSKSAYKLISLSKGRAYSKYGERARGGAIELISQD